MKYATSLGLLLLGAYLLWSGLAWPWGHHFEPLLLWLGIVSVALVLVIASRMRIVDAEATPVQLVGLRVLAYLPWLAWEVAKANVDVIRRILDPRLPIGPRMIRVAAGQRSDVGRVLYANSITLTPGTVSVLVEDGEITVHALTHEAAAGVEGGEMDRRVAALEERS